MYRVYDDYSPHGWGTDVLISKFSLESDEDHREKFLNKDGIIKFRVVNVTLITTQMWHYVDACMPASSYTCLHAPAVLLHLFVVLDISVCILA